MSSNEAQERWPVILLVGHDPQRESHTVAQLGGLEAALVGAQALPGPDVVLSVGPLPPPLQRDLRNDDVPAVSIQNPNNGAGIDDAAHEVIALLRQLDAQALQQRLLIAVCAPLIFDDGRWQIATPPRSVVLTDALTRILDPLDPPPADVRITLVLVRHWYRAARHPEWDEPDAVDCHDIQKHCAQATGAATIRCAITRVSPDAAPTDLASALLPPRPRRKSTNEFEPTPRLLAAGVQDEACRPVVIVADSVDEDSTRKGRRLAMLLNALAVPAVLFDPRKQLDRRGPLKARVVLLLSDRVLAESLTLRWLEQQPASCLRIRPLSFLRAEQATAREQELARLAMELARQDEDSLLREVATGAWSESAQESLLRLVRRWRNNHSKAFSHLVGAIGRTGAIPALEAVDAMLDLPRHVCVQIVLDGYLMTGRSMWERSEPNLEGRLENFLAACRRWQPTEAPPTRAATVEPTPVNPSSQWAWLAATGLQAAKIRQRLQEMGGGPVLRPPAHPHLGSTPPPVAVGTSDKLGQLPEGSIPTVGYVLLRSTSDEDQPWIPPQDTRLEAVGSPAGAAYRTRKLTSVLETPNTPIRIFAAHSSRDKTIGSLLSETNRLLNSNDTEVVGVTANTARQGAIPDITHELAQFDRLLIYLDHPSVHAGVELGVAIGYRLPVMLLWKGESSWYTTNGFRRQLVEAITNPEDLARRMQRPPQPPSWHCFDDPGTSIQAGARAVLLPSQGVSARLANDLGRSRLRCESLHTLNALVEQVAPVSELFWVIPTLGPGGAAERPQLDELHFRAAVAAGVAYARGARVRVLREISSPTVLNLPGDEVFSEFDELRSILEEAGLL